MEAKLREYRALRRRKEIIDAAKEKLKKSKEKIVNFLVPDRFAEMEIKNDEEVLLMENTDAPILDLASTPDEEPVDLSSELSEVDTLEEVKQESWQYFIIKWSIYTITWITMFAIFVKLQFGAVFFVTSLLIGIYLNTRTRPKKKGEVSAYSVFNQNCVSIDGTLKAEQFEREIRYGPSSVR